MSTENKVEDDEVDEIVTMQEILDEQGELTRDADAGECKPMSLA